MPELIRDSVGFALYMAQKGLKPANAKILTGFGSAGVLEVVEDDSGGIYRAVYTVRFASTIYVLHCFQKKSTHGKATSKQDIEMVHKRLAEASELAAGDGR